MHLLVSMAECTSMRFGSSWSSSRAVDSASIDTVISIMSNMYTAFENDALIDAGHQRMQVPSNPSKPCRSRGRACQTVQLQFGTLLCTCCKCN